MTRKWKVLFSLLTMGTLVTSCLEEKRTLEPLKKGTGKIKVMYDNEASFYNRYGNLFHAKYPDIQIEVVSSSEARREGEEEIKKLIEKHKPDVLLLDEKLFSFYAQKGNLYDLETVIAEEKFDLAGYRLDIIDNLRTKGNGRLYALVPSFHAPVLYYNRDLFKENHITAPRNKMSWQEVFDLSKRFEGMGSGKNQVFGLYQSHLWDTARILQHIARTFSLQMFDSKAKELLIDSDNWAKLVEFVTNAIRAKAISFSAADNNHASVNDPYAFIHGKAAMAIEGYWLIQMLQDPGVYGGKAKKINWDMVTIPIDPKNPDESAHIHLEEIYAISADSPNKSTAWEFMKFINGPEIAKALSRSKAGGMLPTRDHFLKEINGRSTEPFYMLKPTQYASDLWHHRNVPKKFYYLYIPLLTDALKAIIDNKKTVNEALADLKVKGQNALAKVREEKKKEVEAGTTAITDS